MRKNYVYRVVYGDKKNDSIDYIDVISATVETAIIKAWKNIEKRFSTNIDWWEELWISRVDKLTGPVV